VQFQAGEAGCVFWEEQIRRLVTGYDFKRLREVMAEFSQWSERNKGHRRPGASSSPWLDVWGYGVSVRSADALRRRVR
jgi:hypothetical protein